MVVEADAARESDDVSDADVLPDHDTVVVDEPDSALLVERVEVSVVDAVLEMVEEVDGEAPTLSLGDSELDTLAE